MSKDRLEYRGDFMGKPRMTSRDKWRKSHKKYFAFKEALGWEMKAQKFEPSDRLKIEFCIPMPKSWSKKKIHEYWLESHKQKPDLDNLVKGVLDSLMVEDKTICELYAKKLWSGNSYIIVTNII